MLRSRLVPIAVLLLALAPVAGAQGVTTAALGGFVMSTDGSPVVGARIRAVHVPSGTPYAAESRSGGAYNIRNMRVGGPYQLVVTMIGFRPDTTTDLFLSLGQDLRLDLELAPQAVQLQALEVTAEMQDEVLNAGRTGAATFVSPAQVQALPSVKRSTRDLTRLDPRSDGNFSFGGRNWLYNNISLDGSYFGNPFGLDDPAPGGQASAEPVPYDAVEQVQVSVAPFDVRQGGFTGANVNTVTRSGTNTFRFSAYGFGRNEQLIGNTVSGSPVVANPDLSFLQTGLSAGGPLIRDRLFFYVNGEIERTDDPGTTFAASTGGSSGFGISRVDAATMDAIRQRLIDEYGYDPGPYQGYVNETNNNKFLAKIDWNASDRHRLSFRWSFLDAERDLGPHPFVLSFNNSGRGPSASSLPFRNSGYRMNNELHSFALEVNSNGRSWANRLFASYNRFRDFRTPFSEPFPTIEIGEAGVTYTTVGHEPFSIHNILDQDVLQFTNNLSLFRGPHVITIGATAEFFSFFNSFNIFRHGVFFLPSFIPVGTTYSSLADFFADTDPANPNQRDLRGLVGSGPFKGENISVGQIAGYLQDEFAVSTRLNVTLGVRVDFPLYLTDPVDNPYSRGLTALDENGNPETVDQSALPGATPLLSPRLGFNWDPTGTRSTQVRGGTGIFTGRVPFVWVGNVISNPGANPNLYPAGPEIPTSADASLQQSFDLNAMDPGFKWPQVWTTDVAIDQQLPWDLLGTLEMVYGRDLNAVFMRNADLVAPIRTLPDGRPYYGGFGANELNSDGGAGIYVIDNTNEGWSLNLTAQLRRQFSESFSAMLAYNYLDARNNLKSTEIASVLWQNQPVQGNPNRPGLSFSEFGQRHRLIGMAMFAHRWSGAMRTQVGVFLEVGQGSQFTAAGGNRYSFLYAGDVNGDGTGGNDLIYIPRDASEIVFESNGAAQWDQLNAFIEQDDYLRTHRGQIAERFGAITPWYSQIDMRILHDFTLGRGSHGFQLSLDMLNVANFISSEWGVRKVANPAATSPLTFTGNFDANGAPILNFTGPASTFVDDPSLQSRWRAQLGLRYFWN